jgi:steroid delta-isomerase
MPLAQLIAFYETLSPQTVVGLKDFYTEDAWFKDPFNEVHGITPIIHIFEHMYRQVEEPRFKILEHFSEPHRAMLVWEFSFGALHPRTKRKTIRGVSHLKFVSNGLINYHRDYWDTAEELYVKLPLMGGLHRLLRSMLSAKLR